jgi:hypothetical protein
MMTRMFYGGAKGWSWAIVFLVFAGCLWMSLAVSSTQKRIADPRMSEFFWVD